MTTPVTPRQSGVSTSTSKPDFRQFKKYVVTDVGDYLDTKPIEDLHKCISCAKCLSPSKNTVLQYKYQKELSTVNSNMFTDSIKVKDLIRQANESYDYDKFRNSLKKEQGKFKYDNTLTSNQLQFKGNRTVPRVSYIET